MNKEQFAALFGPIVRVFAGAKPILHLVSFSGGVLFCYFVSQNQIETLGLSGNYFADAVSLIFTLAGAYTIEYLHYYVPSMFFRLLYTVATWWRHWRTWAMFFFLGGLLAGLTLLSQHTSSQGGKMAVDHQRDTAPPILKDSLVAESMAYSSDSAAIASEYNEMISAKRLEKQASQAAAAEPFEAQVREYQAALIGHRRDKARGNQWAQSWIDKRNQQVRSARAKAKSAKAQAALSYEASIAEIRSQKAAALVGRTRLWTNEQQRATDQQQAKQSAFSAMMDSRSMAALKIGFWVVLLIVFIDGIIIFYEVGSGREYKGVEWKPSGRFSAWVGYVGGILGDKIDHINDRTKATREHLKDRQEAQPFKLPTGRIVVRSLALMLLVFAGFQLPEMQDHYFASFSIVPSPWNWPFALVAIVVALLVFGDKLWDRTTISATKRQPRRDSDSENDNRDSSSDNSDNDATESTEKAVSLVGQRGLEKLDYDKIAKTVTPELLQSYKDQYRHSQKRQHTSQGATTRQKHRDKFVEARGVLNALGYRFAPDGTYRSTHKIDDAPQVVTFEREKWVK